MQGVENIQFVDVPTNDSWIRDFGPVFLTGVENQPPAVVDWEYNAWGGKYPPFEKDSSAGARIAELEGRLRFAGPLVLEPGAIEGNGQGVVLTTASCLLDPNRNPDARRELVEQHLSDCLAAKKIIWLEGGGIAGDDTDGHIDQTARFVAPNMIVAAYDLESSGAEAQVLQRNVEVLRESTDHVGQPFDVKLLFNPPPLFQDGHRLPASYCNFYILNSAVIMPTFDCAESDDAALAVLQDVFPERTVIGFPCRELVWGLGAVHCLTQQEPRPTGLTTFGSRSRPNFAGAGRRFEGERISCGVNWLRLPWEERPALCCVSRSPPGCSAGSAGDFPGVFWSSMRWGVWPSAGAPPWPKGSCWCRRNCEPSC